MRPDKTQPMYNLSFFETPLSDFIDKRHELVRLSEAIDWDFLEEVFAKYYQEVGRKGKNLRLLLGLQILSYMKSLSDEAVCALWVENPYFQYFCGEKLFCHKLPIDRSSISRFRSRVDVEDLEKILQESLAVAHKSGALKAVDVTRIAVDTTVQNKAVDSPSESKLLLDAILDLGRSAKKSGLKLKQNYRFVAKALFRKASGYAHAKQMNRLKKTNKKLKNIVYKLSRRIDNAARASCIEYRDLPENLQERLVRARRVMLQDVKDKEKLLVWHAPEVECIGKGKIKKPYEFGCKVSMATNINQSKGGHFILSSMALHGKPYDGHTLNATIENVAKTTGVRPNKIYVDKGYIGHDYSEKQDVYRSGQKRGVIGRIRKELKRRSAIEPIIGHAKADHKMESCRLKGKKGDQINAIFAAIGFNFKQILNWYKKLGHAFCQILFFAIIQPTYK